MKISNKNTPSKKLNTQERYYNSDAERKTFSPQPSKSLPSVSLFKKDLQEIEQYISILVRLRKIRNELLSCCAYHEKNMEVQVKQLERVKAPQEEIDFITHSWDIQKKFADILFKKLMILTNKIEKIITI